MKALKFPFERLMQSTVGWQWIRNFERTLGYRLEPRFGSYLKHAVSELRSEGVVVRQAGEIFDEKGMELLEAIRLGGEAKISQPEIREALEWEHSGDERKDYSINLFGNEFGIENPVIQLATQRSLLRLVNGYLGMWSYLRHVEVWLTFPTPAPAKETQLWHRDRDDRMNVKVFVYLNDVDEKAGPLCFIPRTHPLGDIRAIVAADPVGRVCCGEMAKAVPAAQWRVCTGPRGTVILADTVGFHRGLKPTGGYRALLTLQYTSGSPRYARVFGLRGTENGKMSNEQRYALFLTGARA